MPHQKLSAFIDAICSFIICNDSSLRGQPVIFNPDFFVEKLRHEKPEVFTELVVSNITRLIDLPGTELAQLMGDVELKLPGGAGPASGFLRSLMSLKRKEKGVVFGSPLTEEGIAQIYQLIEYLHKSVDDNKNGGPQGTVFHYSSVATSLLCVNSGYCSILKLECSPTKFSVVIGQEQSSSLVLTAW
ncbi:rho GTPase-activating protein 19 [Fukomys damarensis]|uniref:rho GTPase-activating protein 19 n=1 Tax=Fukomys damarensis TaxID=885580 RepID=UPI00145541B4|nr:rho GTPase-activating protein 19 [Fukomys damarensis]